MVFGKHQKDLGWVLVYIAAFGISHYFIKQMDLERKGNEVSLIVYYTLVGAGGLYMLAAPPLHQPNT